MWNFSRKAQKTLITVVIEQRAISFCAFKKFDAFSENKFKRIDLLTFEIHNGVIFNQTVLQAALRSFLQEHHLSNVFVAISLEGSVLKEQLIIFQNDDTPFDVVKTTAPCNVWNLYFLSTPSHELKQAYLFSIAREIIMQYQLLALSTPFNCCLLTSSLRALLEEVSGNASQVYKDVYELKQSINNSFLHQALTHQNVSNTEYVIRATHKGLFSLGKQVLDEKYS